MASKEQEALSSVEVTKRFGGITALDNVDFLVRDHDNIGIIGPNGAGKTTIFNVICGNLKPTSGKMFFHGREITRLKPHQIVKLGIARTFQIVRPFNNMTVLENVMVPFAVRSIPTSRARELALDILENLSLSRPNESPRNLAHGELKVLEIAKALASSPKLLLLDEPFSGLSLEEIDRVSELIQRVHKEGHGVVIIEHSLQHLFRLVSKVMVIDKGTKIAEGTPEEVIADSKVVAAYLGSGAYA